MDKLRARKKLSEAGKIIVTGVKMYPNGTAVIIRRGKQIEKEKDRGEIKGYSRASRERLAIVSRETIVQFGSMITLSYGKQYPLDGKAAKRQLNRFLTWYRRVVGGEYIWWLEFQKRGAPHFHIASQRNDINWALRETMADQWAKCQGLTYGLYYSDIETKIESNLYDDVFSVHSHQRQWSKSRKKDGPIRYILKYALKMRQKEVPKNYRNVGRFYGYSRGVVDSIPEPKVINTAEAEIREWLRKTGHITSEWEFLPKNIFGTKGEPGLGEVSWSDGDLMKNCKVDDTFFGS